MEKYVAIQRSRINESVLSNLLILYFLNSTLGILPLSLANLNPTNRTAQKSMNVFLSPHHQLESLVVVICISS